MMLAIAVIVVTFLKGLFNGWLAFNFNLNVVKIENYLLKLNLIPSRYLLLKVDFAFCSKSHCKVNHRMLNNILLLSDKE